MQKSCNKTIVKIKFIIINNINGMFYMWQKLLHLLII